MENENNSTWNWRHPLWILLGTILVGAIGSGLWDIGVKPSLVWIGQSVLDIATFGSQAAKDSAYKAAALDQTASPAAQVYTCVIATFIACLTFLVMLAIGLSPSQIRKRITSGVHPPTTAENGQTESDAKLVGKLATTMKIARALLVIEGILAGVFFFRFLIDNQSLLIWRSFHADLKQCAPYLTPEEEEMIQARFAGMTSKKDFGVILERFVEIADKNNISLHSNRLW